MSTKPEMIVRGKIRGDNRPSDYEYAVISTNIYEKKLVEGQIVETPGNNQWRIYTTRYSEVCGYFGAIYICDARKQIVVAHRGTNSLKDVIEDIRGIFFNQSSPQKGEAFALTKNAVDLVDKMSGYHLSFTGHSLGAFLAELSVDFAKSRCNIDVNGVTFESPGSLKSISALYTKHQTSDSDLDIISYVCYPNLINVVNEHVGTMYNINVDLGSIGWFPGLHLLKSHSSNRIVEWFKQDAEDNPSCRRYYMSEWPRGILQRNVFFKYAEFDNGQYTLKKELRTVKQRNTRVSSDDDDIRVMQKYWKNCKKKFELRHKGNYQVCKGLSKYNVIPTRHLMPDFRNFMYGFCAKLTVFLGNHKRHRQEMRALLENKWLSMGLPQGIVECLINVKIRRNEIQVEEIEVEPSQNIVVFRREFSNWLEKKEIVDVGHFVPSSVGEFDVITTHENYVSLKESRMNIYSVQLF